MFQKEFEETTKIMEKLQEKVEELEDEKDRILGQKKANEQNYIEEMQILRAKENSEEREEMDKLKQQNRSME